MNELPRSNAERPSICGICAENIKAWASTSYWEHWVGLVDDVKGRDVGFAMVLSHAQSFGHVSGHEVHIVVAIHVPS